MPSASLTAEGYFEAKLPPVVVAIWREHVACVRKVSKMPAAACLSFRSAGVAVPNKRS
ncbi:MAG: hypothetical protein ACTS7I_01955 [Candidatus Hodgkinia cicadicola]